LAELYYYGIILGIIYEWGGYGLPACILAHIGSDLSILCGGSLLAGTPINWWARNGSHVGMAVGAILGPIIVWLIYRRRKWRLRTR